MILKNAVEPAGNDMIGSRRKKEEIGMAYEKAVLGSLLSDHRIKLVAKDAIRNRDLEAEPIWNMSLEDLKAEQLFSGEIGSGIERLYKAADTGDWYYPLYSEEECAENEARKGVSLVWFPSDLPEADKRPFILLVP